AKNGLILAKVGPVRIGEGNQAGSLGKSGQTIGGWTRKIEWLRHVCFLVEASMSTRRRITVFLLALAGLCLSMGTGLPREQCLGPGLGTGHIAWSESDFMGLPASCASGVEASPKACAAVVEPLPKPCAPVCPVAVQRVEDPPTPVVKIRVRVPACEVTGQELKYCICVENCSRANAHHVLVKNALPKNARF